MAGTILEASRVGLRFGGVRALSEVDMVMQDGEILGLIGPNGAGKTSLFNCFTGFYTATEGRVTFMGHEITRAKPDRIANLGIRRTFQNLRLFPSLTALENALAGAHTRADGNLVNILIGTGGHRSSEQALVDHADELLNFVGVSRYRETPARLLPYGMQKRLELARALIGEPKLLLLDEPAAGLNTFERREMGALIGMINQRGISVLMIEHDMEMVMSVAQRVMVLDYGRKIAEGPPQAVQRDPAVIAAYLGGDIDDERA